MRASVLNSSRFFLWREISTPKRYFAGGATYERRAAFKFTQFIATRIEFTLHVEH
jgi:hypothetical protein